jgi:hypothetical protein
MRMNFNVSNPGDPAPPAGDSPQSTGNPAKVKKGGGGGGNVVRRRVSTVDTAALISKLVVTPTNPPRSK